MEDVSEDFVIYLVLINLIRFEQTFHIFIIELLLASLVCVEEGWRNHLDVIKNCHHFVCLLLFVIGRAQWFLTRCQGSALDGVLALYHHLQHESAHLSRLSVFRGIVVSECDVVGSLQHTVEIVGKDSHLVLYRGKSVCIAERERNKRRVVDSLRQLTLVAGEYQDMVEIEVSGFEHTHHLYSFCRFTMEWNRGGLDKLLNQSLQGDDIYLQVSSHDEVLQAVEQGIGAVKRFMEEWIFQLLGMDSDGAEHVEQVSDEFLVVLILTCCILFLVSSSFLVSSFWRIRSF